MDLLRGDKMQVLQSIRKVTGAIYKILLWVGILVLVFSTGMTFVNVVLRYVFKSSISGSFEMTSYCLSLIVLLSMAQTQQEKGHIRVMLLPNLFPEKLRIAVDLFALLLGCVLWAGTGFALWRWAGTSLTTGEIAPGPWPFSIWPFKYGSAIGILAYAFVTAEQMLDDVILLFRKKGKAEEKEEVKENE